MKTRIVKIGNSCGVRIPKPLLEHAGLDGEVEVCLQNNALVIRRTRKPRAGWARQFRDMAKCGDDALLDADAPTLSRWDEEEWEW